MSVGSAKNARYVSEFPSTNISFAIGSAYGSRAVDVSGEPGVTGPVVRLGGEPVGELAGDVGTVLQRPDLHLLRADREDDRVGLGQPAQGLALAAQPQILGRDRRVGGARARAARTGRRTRGSSSCGASSPPAAAADRGTCRPSWRARPRSAAPARGSPLPASRSCPPTANATGSTRTPPPSTNRPSSSGSRTHRSSCTDSAGLDAATHSPNSGSPWSL